MATLHNAISGLILLTERRELVTWRWKTTVKRRTSGMQIVGKFFLSSFLYNILDSMTCLVDRLIAWYFSWQHHSFKCTVKIFCIQILHMCLKSSIKEYRPNNFFQRIWVSNDVLCQIYPSIYSERNDNIYQKCDTKSVGLEPDSMEFINTGKQWNILTSCHIKKENTNLVNQIELQS